MKKCILLYVFLISIFCFPIFSQEEPEIETTGQDSVIDAVNAEDESENNNNVYVISSFVFKIDGYTRSWVLVNKGEFVAGKVLYGHAALEKYIADKTQLLVNERVLERVRITYSLGEVQSDGKYPVNLVISVKDSWNIIAIPRPQYSSSTGFDLTLKARDYNFLGTMSPLRMDIGYRYNEEGDTFFDLMIDSDIPFRAFNLNWEFNFDHDFVYRPDMQQQYYYKNTTGLSVELPFYFTTFTFGFDESFIYNQENAKRYRKESGRFQEGLYMSSNPYVSWKIPTGLEIGNYGELIYTPKFGSTFNHELSEPLHDHRKGPFLSFGHSLGFGKIDWIGNFLRGYSASVSNNYKYNFYYARIDEDPLSANINITGKGHITFDDIFGISTRLMYRQWFRDDYSDNAGDVLRGIIDKNVTADFMVSLNFDVPMKLIKVRPSEWFDKSKLRVMNFDVHVSPFIDAAIYRNPEYEKLYKNMDFTFKNVLVSGGMEFIIFPEFFRSLFLRASLGFNFSTMLNMSTYEIFIGTELHY